MFKLQINASQIAQFDDALSKSITFGVTAAQSAIKAKGWDHIDVQNQVLGTALNYAVTNFPTALAGVGLSANTGDPHNLETIKNALKRAFPDAMAKASASPATPPTPTQAAMISPVVVETKGAA